MTSTTATHCPFCALQCGMTLRRTPGAALPVEVAGRAGGTVNDGALCGKGAASARPLSAAARLTEALVRENGVLRTALWDEALDRAASGLDRVRQAHGANAVGVFGSGALTNEKAYLLGKFARIALRTANIDYNGRFCMASAAAAGRRLGLDRGLPFPVADIEHTGAVLLSGSNIAETMPPIVPYFRRMRERGGLLITVDPRRTRTAVEADIHLQPVPGLRGADGLARAP